MNKEQNWPLKIEAGLTLALTVFGVSRWSTIVEGRNVGDNGGNNLCPTPNAFDASGRSDLTIDKGVFMMNGQKWEVIDPEGYVKDGEMQGFVEGAGVPKDLIGKGRCYIRVATGDGFGVLPVRKIK